MPNLIFKNLYDAILFTTRLRDTSYMEMICRRKLIINKEIITKVYLENKKGNTT